MKSLRVCTVTVLAIVFSTGLSPLSLSLPVPARAQAIAEILPDEPVPEGYKSQVLFLICNPDWLLEEKEEDLLSLYAYFQAFGRAIGKDNVAVWFWRSQPDLADGLADDVDVERSASSCTQLELRPSEGPHIVVTSKWDTDHLVLALGGLDAAGARTVLAVLTDKLVAGGIDAAEVQDQIFWQTWRQAWDEAIGVLGSVARASKFKIVTKFFTWELDGSLL